MKGLCSVLLAHLCLYRFPVFLTEYYMDMLNILYDIRSVINVSLCD